MGLSKMPIKLDCNQVVDNISSNLDTNSMFESILDICKDLLKFFQNFKISVVMKQINKLVHL